MGFIGGRSGVTRGSGMFLEGEKEMLRLFKELPQRIAERALLKALMAGAAPIKTAAIAKAPRDTGALAKSIRIVKARRRYRTSRAVVIGPASIKTLHRTTKTGKRRRVTARGLESYFAKGGSASGLTIRNPAKYAHLVEFGHRTANGTVGAKQFMRPGFDSMRGEAQRRIAAKLRKEIEREARRLAKR